MRRSRSRLSKHFRHMYDIRPQQYIVRFMDLVAPQEQTAWTNLASTRMIVQRPQIAPTSTVILSKELLPLPLFNQ